MQSGRQILLKKWYLYTEQTTQSHYQADDNIHSDCCVNLKLQIPQVISSFQSNVTHTSPEAQTQENFFYNKNQLDALIFSNFIFKTFRVSFQYKI
jgi:Holliday junction resolvasome RuvABC endonuclease subunit